MKRTDLLYYLFIFLNRGFRGALFYHQTLLDAETQGGSRSPVTFPIKRASGSEESVQGVKSSVVERFSVDPSLARFFRPKLRVKVMKKNEQCEIKNTKSSHDILTKN